jgi:hypothetical protein
MFPDGVNWAHAFVLDAELFETPLPGLVRNPSLRQFWLFETATAAARAEYGFGVASEIADPNFEEIQPPPALPKPSVKRHGVVDRGLAAALSSLMQAEQSEVLNLYAVAVAMNRATEARYERGRQDWVNWQQAAAAGYARRVSAAIGRVIAAQRRVGRALVRHHLLFGVGSTDLKLAHRNVRKDGFAPSIVNLLTAFGFDSSLVSHLKQFFMQTSFGQLSFSLPQFLSQPSVISAESAFRAALAHFAARTPPASRPPT